MAHLAFIRVPGTFKRPPQAQLGAGGCEGEGSPCPSGSPGVSLVLPSCGEGQQWEDPAQLPSSSPHLQLLVSVGGGGDTDGGQHGDAGSPSPSPGQRALGEKDLAKRGVGEHEVLEGRTHEVCTCVCAHVCGCVGE